MTVEDYLIGEQTNSGRRDFLLGEAYLRPDISSNARRIIQNIDNAVSGAFKELGYVTCPGNMPVEVLESQLYTYADFVISAGVDDKIDRLKIRNPYIVIDILPSKVDHIYWERRNFHLKRINSLRGYMAIYENMMLSQFYSKNKDDTITWEFADAHEQNTFCSLHDAIGVTLSDIYDGTNIQTVTTYKPFAFNSNS